MVKITDLLINNKTKVERIIEELKIVHEYLDKDVNQMIMENYAETKEMDKLCKKFWHITDKLNKIIGGI